MLEIGRVELCPVRIEHLARALLHILVLYLESMSSHCIKQTHRGETRLPHLIVLHSKRS